MYCQRSSSYYPIRVPPAGQPPFAAQTHGHWSSPGSNMPLESFSWPSMWFDVPPLTPPELDHSKTPDSSPASLHDACITPSHDSGTNVTAVCDVPLVAPRPLPFTPPAFLQFDFLPDEDEDLSFPPYTHSRRRFSDSESESDDSPPTRYAENSNPRKRCAPPPVDAECRPLPAIAKKRRKVTLGMEMGLGTAAAAAGRARRVEPAVFVGDGDSHMMPQLMHFGQMPLMMGWMQSGWQ